MLYHDYADVYICIQECMYVIIWQGIDFFVLMIIYVCMYVSMVLSDRVIRDHPCGGMIAYAGERHEEILGSWEINWEE